MWRHRRRYSGVTLFTANIDKTEFQMVYAGFWLRLAAFIIDAVILSVLIFAIVFCLIFILALTGTVDENQISAVVQLINLVVAGWPTTSASRPLASKARRGKLPSRSRCPTSMVSA